MRISATETSYVQAAEEVKAILTQCKVPLEENAKKLLPR
jgi:hypothetical protein